MLESEETNKTVPAFVKGQFVRIGLDNEMLSIVDAGVCGIHGTHTVIKVKPRDKDFYLFFSDCPEAIVGFGYSPLSMINRVTNIPKSLNPKRK